MLTEDIQAAVLRNPVHDPLLDDLIELGLPDAWIVAGCLAQTVWNLQTGRPVDYGIKDPVGIQRGRDGDRIYAPAGLDDIPNLIVRPNLTLNFSAYRIKTARWMALWPELTVLPPDRSRDRRQRANFAMTFDDIRNIALAWPEVEDGTSYGTPALKVRKKMLVRLKEDGDSLAMPGVPPDERDMLVESQPKVFYFTDHYRDYPMVLIRLSKAKRGAIEPLLRRQWQALASKAARKAFEAER